MHVNTLSDITLHGLFFDTDRFLNLKTMQISYLSSRSNTRFHTFCSSLWPNQLFLQSNSALGSMRWDPISYRDSGLSIRLRINLNTRWKNHSQSRYTVCLIPQKYVPGTILVILTWRLLMILQLVQQLYYVDWDPAMVLWLHFFGPNWISWVVFECSNSCNEISLR